jgi:hypothetical protein
MTEWRGPRPPKPRFLGFALVTIGVLFLLRELDVLPDISFWTMLWLGLGGWLFVGTMLGSRRGWFWPLTLLAIGGAMLLRDLEVFDRDFSIWPVVVIAIGLSILAEAGAWGSGRRTEDATAPWE